MRFKFIIVFIDIGILYVVIFIVCKFLGRDVFEWLRGMFLLIGELGREGFRYFIVCVVLGNNEGEKKY